MRVFLAVDLPEHIKSRIFHKFEVLSKKNLFIGKPVKKENLHLTLRFFGNLSNKQIDDLRKKLKEESFDSLGCSIGKIGFFDNENNIKVIWFEFLSDGLDKLDKKLFKVLGGKEGQITPHITTARVRSVINKQQLLKEINTLKFRNLDFNVNEMVLMKSILTPKGPQYKIIEKFPLKN